MRLSWFDAVLADSAALSPATLAAVLADKATLDAVAGGYGRLDQAEPALAIARELDDPALLARALTACATMCTFDNDTAAPYFAEAIERTRALGDDWWLGRVLAWQAISAFTAGDLIAALAAGAAGRDLADGLGDGSISRMCRWAIGMAQWLSADLSAAVEQLSAAAAEAQVAHDRCLLRATCSA